MNGFALYFGSEHPCGYWSPERICPQLHLLSKEIGEPVRDTRTERVPYSTTTFHFDDICGVGYGERTLKYQYEMMSKGGRNDKKPVEYVYAEIKKALRFSGIRELRDMMFPGFFFEAHAPTVQLRHPQNSVFYIDITFSANPAMLPETLSSPLAMRLQDWKYPDVNGDGAVTAADSALILGAALNIAAGRASGLTAAQEALADADRDGSITPSDAALVQEYAAAVSMGQFPDNSASWYAYLQRYFRLKEAVF